MFSFVRSKKGFTFTELLVVLGVFSLMVAVALPIYSKMGEKTARQSCFAQQRKLKITLTTYFIHQKLTSDVSGEMSFTTQADGKTVDFKGDSAIYDSMDADNALPYCPVAGNVITAKYTVKVKGKSKKITITTSCSEHGVVVKEKDPN